MAMRSWLGTHRKQVITHTSIIVAFALLTIFVLGPLFDTLEQFAGASQLYETSLPAVTDNIEYSVDHFESAAGVVEIYGWAFIEDHDSANSEIYIVLKSTDRTYVFTTETVVRESVTEQFKELGLNLDNSGFSALIPTWKIASGEYSVGICIEKNDVEALVYTNKAIIKSGNTVKTV
jgi:hypothetical protein